MESSSGVAGTGPLLLALIGVAALVVAGAAVLVVVLSRRRSSTPGPAPQGPGVPAPGRTSPGWYPDPQGQARLRWFDGTHRTLATQN